MESANLTAYVSWPPSNKGPSFSNISSMHTFCRWSWDWSCHRVSSIGYEAFTRYTQEQDKVRHFAVGAVSYLAVKPLIELMELLTTQAMKRLVGNQKFNQSMALLFAKSFNHPAGPWLIGGYLAIIEPMMMELFCRGNTYDEMKAIIDTLPVSGPMKLAICCASSAILYAISHLSPFQNITTNTLCCVTFFAVGIVLTLLREHTNGLWASTALHATCNIAAMIGIAKMI